MSILHWAKVHAAAARRDGRAAAKVIPNPGLLCWNSPESKGLRNRKCNIKNSVNYCNAMTIDCGPFWKSASWDRGEQVANLVGLCDRVDAAGWVDDR